MAGGIHLNFCGGIGSVLEGSVAHLCVTIVAPADQPIVGFAGAAVIPAELHFQGISHIGQDGVVSRAGAAEITV